MFHSHGTLDISPSDHCLNFVIHKMMKVDNPTAYTWLRSYRKYNPNVFKHAISLANWDAPYKWIKIKEHTADWITNEFLSVVDTRNF